MKNIVCKFNYKFYEKDNNTVHILKVKQVPNGQHTQVHVGIARCDRVYDTFLTID